MSGGEEHAGGSPRFYPVCHDVVRLEEGARVRLLRVIRSAMETLRSSGRSEINIDYMHVLLVVLPRVVFFCAKMNEIGRRLIIVFL